MSSSQQADEQDAKPADHDPPAETDRGEPDQNEPDEAGSPDATPEQNEAPQRRYRPFVLLALVLCGIAAAGIVWYLLNRNHATTDDAEIDGDIYMIAPKISGQVSRVLVTDNQHVAAGQALILLDPRDQQVALERARAQQAEADAQLESARASAGEAAANIAVAAANLRQAQQDYVRYHTVDPAAVSQQQLDAATATIRADQARFNAALQQQRGQQASVDSAAAALAAAAVATRDAALQLSYTTLTAPAAGHVSQRTVRAGNVVAPGAGLLALVGDQVWVTANYKETQLGRIRRGARATVVVDSVPGVVFKAHVDSIGYGTGSVFSLLPAENATGNYVKIVQRVPVKIVFDDSRTTCYPLAPGMSVNPSIDLAAK